MSNNTTTAKQQEVKRIVDVLSKAIAQHRLRPGARLIEAQIVEALNANRNHVQVALQRLAMQRIVTIEPNRGAMVAQPTAKEAREIFIARRAIERAIVEVITPEMMRRHRHRVTTHLCKEREATNSTDRRAIVRELSEFHLVLGEICGNEVLSEVLANLMVRSSLIVALYQRNDVPSCQSDEHQAIVDALEAGENARAVTVMIEHLHDLEAQLELEEQSGNEVNLRQALADL
ncbi:GntR family transcriptional regulator [Rouxiella badensis]|jgi:DNA-binding GntR family transcriptional regulator|uniref:GntR family transcriptional regulator n=1 Tax=Rouxiella badensis TaxID=1646377 RepID=A0A1X0WIU6_9GAMM|nr:GntR family transcriptional regulator [Rouxiella badensis]MCC3701709.1 GntR family transcriptional regulator [Rouxiella badensis]MCC3720103.1 GntR family transcriptional regulator [Rouxiella badensis]MCC3729766.1 GntR family transcriptional regulator [Rouxiella badensis]MCC3731351.1 GntR family transcriptional regulator [Rouxiella badensis]MCC3738286.1 GntR family transcriptional regulator [Rouxiella badensis]